ncbi:MAG TPA: hypothetical protein VM510_12840 [Caulifigura sp.]|nr:hypothetical protein [Caulifigura sp.]
MSEVTITFRIPGAWDDPGELVERLPDGYRIDGDLLQLPDGGQFEFFPMVPDSQFPGIFRSSCRQPATASELELLDRYSVNIGLTGPGGSMDSALAMMQAAAALVRAGAAGVFIDNCAVAHGGQAWIGMTEDASSDAISYAFVSVIAGGRDMSTMGMHVLGYPDLLLESSDVEAAGDTIVDAVRSLCAAGREIGPGHLLAFDTGASFQLFPAPSPEFAAGSPLHNPYGRLKLVSTRDLAQGN